MLLLVLLQNTFFLFSNICNGSQLMNVFNNTFLIYKVIQTNQLTYISVTFLLFNLPLLLVRLLSLICVAFSTPRLCINVRSFTYYFPILWNSLPRELRLPASHSTATPNYSFPLLVIACSQIPSKLMTFLFTLSYPP